MKKISKLCYDHYINVLKTNKFKRESLFNLFDKIQDTKLNKEYLTQLKNIILKEDSISPPPTSSLTKWFEKYRTTNILKKGRHSRFKNEK